MKRKFFLILFLGISIAGLSQGPPDFQKALQTVNPDQIESTMGFLASDLLEGRQPGTRGFAIASQYVQAQFKALGLMPGGESNQYVQRVLLKKGVVERS